MDLFEKHMEVIIPVAEKMAKSWHGKVEVDELIDSAYLKYRVAIRNNPSLVEGVFSSLPTFLRRVKLDMFEHIRTKTGVRTKLKKKMINNTMTASFQVNDNIVEDGIEPSCPSCTDKGYQDVENSDFLNAIFEKVELTDREWKVIQGYFWEGKTVTEVGMELGATAKNASGKVSWVKKGLISKLRKQACLLK